LAGRRLKWLRRWGTTVTALLGTSIYIAFVMRPHDVAFARSYRHASPLVEVANGLLLREITFGTPALVIMLAVVWTGPGLRLLAGGLPPGWWRWQPAVMPRLAGREDLPPERMRDEHFPATDIATLRSLMVLFQDEGFPAGRFRPDDDLRPLLEPEPTWNPLRWFLTRPRYEDSTVEIEYQLGRRGITRLSSTRFRDVVQAWADAAKC
jgi:hypothetical protein